MQWDELKAHLDAVLPAGNAEPAMGDPHPSLARALIRELHVDEGRHYFASWTGYAEGSAPPIIDFPPSRREMALYAGVLIDAWTPTSSANRTWVSPRTSEPPRSPSGKGSFTGTESHRELEGGQCHYRLTVRKSYLLGPVDLRGGADDVGAGRHVG